MLSSFKRKGLLNISFFSHCYTNGTNNGTKDDNNINDKDSSILGRILKKRLKREKSLDTKVKVKKNFPENSLSRILDEYLKETELKRDKNLDKKVNKNLSKNFSDVDGYVKDDNIVDKDTLRRFLNTHDITSYETFEEITNKRSYKYFVNKLTEYLQEEDLSWGKSKSLDKNKKDNENVKNTRWQHCEDALMSSGSTFKFKCSEVKTKNTKLNMIPESTLTTLLKNTKEYGETLQSIADKAAAMGVVSMIKDGIITILKLKQLKCGEIVWIRGTNNTYIRALVLNLNENDSQGILLGNERFVVEGAVVYRSGSLFKLPCSLSLFGQVLDALGENKLKKKKSYFECASLVEQKATGIIDRKPVRIPLRTGIKSIDSLVPIGRGQRELIIGDRQTGKTSVALDSILNHAKLNRRFIFDSKASRISDLRKIVWFVYNAIGQKQSTVNQFKESLIKHNAFWYTSIVASTASEPAPLQFLSPYTACTLGEYIRDIIGGHCTVIYDDLSKHAVAYRQMSLLLRRPPGREAFPGDVFYVHSRLLERAGSLTITSEKTRGTLTAFPVIETQAGDVSAYIPTNVISITDGQIFLETELFYRGIRPAVNVGLSVSRVGSAAQPGIMKKIAGSLKMELAQYREIEGFSKLGASLDEQTQRLLNRGENLIELLKQNLHAPLTTMEQVLSIYLGVGYNGSWLNDVSKLKIKLHNGLNLVNRVRVRTSWLDWFRALSNDFNIFQIAPFVTSFLNFVNHLGIINMSLYEESEKQLLNLLKLHPIVFFDDILVSFFRECSTLGNSNMDSTEYHISALRLYELRYKSKPEVMVLKNNDGISSNSNLESDLMEFSLVGLCLKSILNKREKSSTLNLQFCGRFVSKFFSKFKQLKNKATQTLFSLYSKLKYTLELSAGFAVLSSFVFFNQKQKSKVFSIVFEPRIFSSLFFLKKKRTRSRTLNGPLL